MKWGRANKPSHRHGDLQPELPADEHGQDDSGCAGDNDAACTDEIERHAESESMLQGSVLEVGGAAAGLMPVESPDTSDRRDPRRINSGDCDDCRR